MAEVSQRQHLLSVSRFDPILFPVMPIDSARIQVNDLPGNLFVTHLENPDRGATEIPSEGVRCPWIEKQNPLPVMDHWIVGVTVHDAIDIVEFFPNPVLEIPNPFVEIPAGIVSVAMDEANPKTPDWDYICAG